MASPVVDKETRVRIQAMLDAKTAEKLKAEALRKGVSVSAMAGMLLKQALEQIDELTPADDMDHRIRKILTVAEREGLI